MDLSELSADEFSAFFEALHQKEPFPWQTRLATEVAIKGRWPSSLDLPTASGKTATIDIALFHLALEADEKCARQAPVRIAFVVDRRIVVDSAYERAQKIATVLRECLNDPHAPPVLVKVAQRLAYLSDGKDPVLARMLRGGVPQEKDWARTPSQPTILCSTVDQVGSRLLLRGYGVSDSMKPVHAGLLGSDCLLLLDEAHLSEPFRQTLESIAQYRRPPWTELEPAPWQFVTLTATPTKPNESKFTLELPDYKHKVLSARLSASKPARLIAAKARTTDLARHASELIEHAWSLSDSGGGTARITALVVNRVALARKCYEALRNRMEAAESSADAVLFIGRSRDADRVALLAEYKDKLISEHADLDRSLFVVTTQSIEAGADFDFDALVTQIAPLDALRQRFGRLNRMGRPITACAAIVACPDEIGSRADDVLYGTRAKQTWEWLTSLGTCVDFGILAMEAQLQSVQIADLITEKRNAPVMMPAHVDLLAQTSPIPFADPEPALFLHGAPDSADVSIVWRADIDTEDLDPKEESGNDTGLARLTEILRLMPPRAAEAISVPIQAARKWLSARPACAVHDVEGAPTLEDKQARGMRRLAMRWVGAESNDTNRVQAHHIRPGDLIVVSSCYGGCDSFGWHPDCDRWVRDVAHLAAKPYASSRLVFRIHRSLLEAEIRQEVKTEKIVHDRLEKIWPPVSRALRTAKAESNTQALISALMKCEELPSWWYESLAALRETKVVQVSFPYDDDSSGKVTGLVFIAPDGLRIDAGDERALSDPSTESDDAGSFRERCIPLERHAEDVQQKADHFASLCGLSSQVTKDVKLAAFLHDEGKRDARFQAYLRRGDRLLAAIDPAQWAKSDEKFENRSAERRARRRAELPEKWRHEADSVRRVLSHPRFAEAHDRHLVLYLVGSHHGYGRPLYPHTDPLASGPQDPDFVVDGQDWTQLFSSLLQRYGVWQLTHMEAILRLADHRASEEEDNT